MPSDQPGVVTTPGDPPDLVELGERTGNGAPSARRRVRRDSAAAQAPPPGPKRLSWRERKQMGRLRARKVGRIIRHVDPWAALKISLLFYFCVGIVVLVAGTILWTIAARTGTIGSFEGAVGESFAFKKGTFHFQGGRIFEASVLVTLIGVLAGAALNVLLCVLFNLISDLIGGVRVEVIEEETARPVA
ncbi:MAG: DUF3566 domain-containing protein [Acidimicrobiales bacterium]